MRGEASDVIIVMAISFFGAMAASFSGAGTGALFLPVFIYKGMEPRVAFATAMYIAMFTCMTSSIAMIMFKRIRLDYALYVMIMTVFGTIPGYFFQQYIQETYKRVSYQMFIGSTLRFTAIITVMHLTVKGFNSKIENG